jgi:hypothetical protein
MHCELLSAAQAVAQPTELMSHVASAAQATASRAAQGSRAHPYEMFIRKG